MTITIMIITAMDTAHHTRHWSTASGGGKKDLLIALSITVLMMVAEIVGGLLSNSLALLSDAGHMFTDNLALLLSFFAMKFPPCRLPTGRPSVFTGWRSWLPS